MTELQQIEYRMLENFLNICNELGLTYYLVCGTALGAAKYNGFIPWDDDIDVAMPRKDYTIFCENAQKFLPDYYFLQNYQTDKKFPAIYSKLRDSRTTYIETGSKNLDINHGVYIDIFPIDGYPTDQKEQKKLEREKRILKFLLSTAFPINKKQKKLTRVIILILKKIGLSRKTNQYASKLESLISQWKLENSSIWCNHGNWQGKLEYAPAWQYGNGLWASFEGLKVRIPEKYDEYLTQKYGDWKAELPKEEQVGHHFYEVCDLDKSYTEYFY